MLWEVHKHLSVHGTAHHYSSDSALLYCLLLVCQDKEEDNIPDYFRQITNGNLELEDGFGRNCIELALQKIVDSGTHPDVTSMTLHGACTHQLPACLRKFANLQILTVSMSRLWQVSVADFPADIVCIDLSESGNCDASALITRRYESKNLTSLLIHDEDDPFGLIEIC